MSTLVHPAISAASERLDCAATRMPVAASALAVVGGRLAAGFPGAGHVAILREDRDGWAVEEIVAPDVLEPGFGAALAADGDRLIVAASPQAGGGGAVFVREADGMLRRLATSGAEGRVGHAVAAGDGVLAWSRLAPGDLDPAGEVVIAAGGTTRMLAAPDPTRAAWFGGSLAIAKGGLIVGAPAESGAWIHDLAGRDAPRFLAGAYGAIAPSGRAVALGDFLAATSSADMFGEARTAVEIAGAPADVLDAGGALAVDGRFLAITQTASPDGERGAAVLLYRFRPNDPPELLRRFDGAGPAVFLDHRLLFETHGDGERRFCSLALPD